MHQENSIQVLLCLQIELYGVSIWEFTFHKMFYIMIMILQLKLMEEGIKNSDFETT